MSEEAKDGLNSELSEQFLSEDFDVEGYAEKILESGTAVSEQLAILASNTVQLDKQLRKQVNTLGSRSCICATLNR